MNPASCIVTTHQDVNPDGLFQNKMGIDTGDDPGIIENRSRLMTPLLALEGWPV